MDLKELESILSLSATPGILVLLGIWLHFELKKMKEDFQEFKTHFKEEMHKIHNNGFVRKDVIAEKERLAQQVHDDLEIRITQLEGRMNRM